MKPLDRLSEYLGAIERRLRLVALTRGAAVTALAALVLTVVAVAVANRFAFSNGSVVGARVFLFLGLAYALAAALIVPLVRLNRRRAAREVERRFPHFEERLLTFQERMEQRPNDPFLSLLAEDALSLAERAEPAQVARGSMIFSFSSAALVSLLALLWLGLYGPDWLGYGTSLLWGGIPKGEVKPYYAIRVEPGNKTIRKRSDLMITATLSGFQAPKVRFFGKYASTSQWEQAEMRTEPGGSAYQFLIAGVPESLDYYVEAGGVRSQTYHLNVVDLPSVKRIRVTYHFPAWSGMKDAVEDPGGDLRAVEGTDAEVAVQTDRPLASGALLLDDGTKIPLRSGPGGLLVASVPIRKDGLYHVAAIENGEDVRLTEDYFIEAQKDQPPEVKITRPGRDFRATPIEEVTVAVEAKDDFGLKEVTLHYAVNGGAEKTVSLLNAKDAKSASGTTTLSLEDFKVQPGDIVSLYATAKDARKTVNTDMFFIEAQPFERNFTQSQQDGGGGGGGDDANQQNEISERQKEIITATWNQLKGQGARGTDAENASFLAGVQSKLRDQAKSLSDRMKARQLEGAGDAFKTFVEDMDKAVEAMAPAADKLKGAHWQDALAPEQKALQYLLRAESTFRDIQVAFGNRGGGGGGGGGASRDMQGLFDLELDTEKNQYESARSTPQSADKQQQQIDEALQKLKDLARRQQELAEQQRNGQQTPQQRWEQELLRREAEKLQQQLQQMQQQQQSQQGMLSRNGQQSQQGQQGQGNQSSQGGQQGQQQQQAQSQGQGGGQQQASSRASAQQQMQQMRNQGQQDGRLSQANAQQLQQMLDRLKQATDDMRAAASSQQNGTPQGEAQARRAADRLREAEQLLSGLQSQQAGNEVESLAKQADDLARRQQDFEGQMRRAYGENSRGVTRDQAEQLAEQKESELGELKKLEQGLQNAVRNLQSTNRQASSKLRNALGDMQQQEIARDMQRNADWIRRGLGQYAAISEAQTTAGLNELRDQVKQVQQALAAGAKDGKDGQNDKAVEQALDKVQQLRQQLERLQAQSGQQGRSGQPRGQQGLLSRGQHAGQQQNGQQAGQQQNGQQAGQQQGGQQGGQQAGGQQGGQQQGGQQANAQGGGQMGGNSPNGGPRNNPGGGAWGAYGGRDNGGNWGNWADGPWNPQQFQQSYRDAVQSLQQLQQGMRDDPGTQRDIQSAIRDLRQFDPFALSNDPMLAQRIAAALAGVEQVEMELRRKVEDTAGGGSVRSPGGEKVPQGYQDQVADYYRKLGKSK
ncbi:MAG TPA: hypothetical protein VKX45_08805 [Bryobacteraceae bacterium]|nr:hypothetical protein [Bryobacteraceae bacterium]